MHWVLSGNIFNEAAWNELLETLQRFNIPYSEHKIVPMIGALVPPDWSGEIGEDPATWPKSEAYGLKNVIVMGPYSLRHVAKHFNWTPGSFDIYECDFQVQLKHWSTHMLNAGAVVSKFKDACWEDDGPRFIRPIHDSKCFAGRVFDYEEFRDWQRNVCVLELDYGNSLTADTLVQICRPKKIYTEFRCWVVNGQIVTVSLYKRGDRVMYENFDSSKGDNIRAYAYERINEWRPHDAFVIDVCETDEGMKIVEINTLNACGFYAADMQKLVLSLEEAFNEPSF